VDQRDWQEKGAGHRQRLRDKFLDHGIDSFTDSEILELLLTFGTPRHDTKEPARALLKQWDDSLAGVLDAPPEELRQIKGIGPKNAFALSFVQGVARRYLKQRLPKRHYFSSSKEAADYLIHEMRGLDREVFIAIFLDSSHGVLAVETLAEGTINCNTIYPREVVKRGLAHKAAALVVAHNHPSGALEPSSQDLQLTRTLSQACNLMHIRLLDHLIVGTGEKVYSFADHGLMARLAEESNPASG